MSTYLSKWTQLTCLSIQTQLTEYLLKTEMMKYTVLLLFLSMWLLACQSENKGSTEEPVPQQVEPANSTAAKPQIDMNSPEIQQKMKDLKPNANNESDEPILVKGVNFNARINQQMVLKGKQVYDGKCASCHNLNDKAFNASGFGGILDRRQAAWVMNMISGVPLADFASGDDIRTLEKCWTRKKQNWLDIYESRDFIELLLNEGSKEAQ